MFGNAWLVADSEYDGGRIKWVLSVKLAVKARTSECDGVQQSRSGSC